MGGRFLLALFLYLGWMGNKKADENQKPQVRLTEILKLLKESWHCVHVATIRKYMHRLKKAG